MIHINTHLGNPGQVAGIEDPCQGLINDINNPKRTNLTCFRDVSTAVMELLIMAYALKTPPVPGTSLVSSLLPLQQAEQDAEEGLHCVQAPGVHAGKAGESRPRPGPTQAVRTLPGQSSPPHSHRWLVDTYFSECCWVVSLSCLLLHNSG